MRLSPEKQDAAKRFIFSEGRPLERSLFAYQFEQGCRDNVLAELAKFQNPDGGFGHALEPDLRSPLSTVAITAHALHILREIGIGSECPLVHRAIRYILKMYDHSRKGWRRAVPEINNAPHAPWWHYDENKGGTPIDEHWGNPSAEIVGYLVRYRDLVPPALLQALYDHTFGYFKDFPPPSDQNHIGPPKLLELNSHKR